MPVLLHTLSGVLTKMLKPSSEISPSLLPILLIRSRILVLVATSNDCSEKRHLNITGCHTHVSSMLCILVYNTGVVCVALPPLCH